MPNYILSKDTVVSQQYTTPFGKYMTEEHSDGRIEAYGELSGSTDSINFEFPIWLTVWALTVTNVWYARKDLCVTAHYNMQNHNLYFYIFDPKNPDVKPSGTLGFSFILKGRWK